MEAKTDFKALSNKAKVEYIWDYYRWHIIGVIFALAFIIYTVHHYVTYREPFLNVIMINCNNSYDTTTEGFDEFQAAYGYDTEEYPVALAAGLYFPEGENAMAMSYTDIQALAAYIASGEEDLFFGTGDVYLNYCEQGVLIDLSTILAPELLAKYEDCLIYSTADGEVDPYPCAIELKDNAWIKKYNYYDTCYFGVFYQPHNLEGAIEFAEFLLSYE